MRRQFRKVPVLAAKSVKIGDQIQAALNEFAEELGRMRGSDITITFESQWGIKRSWFVGDSYKYKFSGKLVETSLLDPSIVLHDKTYHFATFHRKGEPFEFCTNSSFKSANDMLDGTSKFVVITLG